MNMSECLADFGYFVSLRPFLALHDLKLDNVALLKGFEALPLDRRIMDENVSSTILADEAVPFAVIEPLDLALKSCHLRSSFKHDWDAGLKWSPQKGKARNPCGFPAPLHVRFPDGHTLQAPASINTEATTFCQEKFGTKVLPSGGHPSRP